MSAIIQGYQIRASQFGVQLIKGGTAGLALPATATATLATVNVGAVYITSMLGYVTTAIQNQACNLSIGTVPTTGSSSTTGIGAATAITNTPIGSWITPVQSAGVGSSLAVGASAGAAVFLSTPFIVAAGTISWTTSATNTGNIRWYFTYIALDNGAFLS